MAPRNVAREEIRHRLQDAIGELRRHLLRVEVWADALDGFSRPVPSYTPDDQYFLPRHERKGR